MREGPSQPTRATSTGELSRTPANRRLNILVIPDKSYPVDHALLENIFCRELPQRGHDIAWLLRSPEATHFGDRRQWQNTEVFLSPLQRSNRLAQLRDSLYLKPRALSGISGILRQLEVDVVQVRNDLPAAIVALLACRRAGIPFVYYLGFPGEEAWAEAAKNGWTRTRYGPRAYAQIALPLRNWVTRHADFVFTMSEHWRKAVIENLDVPADRIKALPFGFDVSIRPEQVSGEEIRRRFALNGDPVVFYMGTIGPPRDVTILADIMAFVAKELPKARLLVLPKKSDERCVPDLERVFAERGVQRNVVFSPSVPHGQVPEYIAAADVGLSPIETIPIYNVSSCAKFVEMLGMGCPVVASDTPEQKSVLQQWQAGVCVPYDAEELGRAVVQLLKNPERSKQLGKQGRSFVEAHRGFAHLADRVEETYLDLTAGSA